MRQAQTFLQHFFLKTIFDAISISLIEAARIDGCSDFKTFKDILLPLSTPIIMVTVIRIVVASWSNFLWPMLVIKDENYMPVTVKLYRMKTQYQLDQYMLALIFGMLPPVVMYIIFQKYILGGQNVGGVKE
ncbi:MAG: ABC transporter permease subunit [Clostridiales bacterium]|nr:MAG: ABC transporter permease subunit [Clostridiales bacterium]